MQGRNKKPSRHRYYLVCYRINYYKSKCENQRLCCDKAQSGSGTTSAWIRSGLTLRILFRIRIEAMGIHNSVMCTPRHFFYWFTKEYLKFKCPIQGYKNNNILIFLFRNRWIRACRPLVPTGALAFATPVFQKRLAAPVPPASAAAAARRRWRRTPASTSPAPPMPSVWWARRLFLPASVCLAILVWHFNKRIVSYVHHSYPKKLKNTVVFAECNCTCANVLRV